MLLVDDLLSDCNKDYDVIIDDGEKQVIVPIHQLVLQVSSPFFNRVIGGQNCFFYLWRVPLGAIRPAQVLLNFFYTRRLTDLSRNKSQYISLSHLALQLELPSVFSFLQRLLRTQHPVHSIHPTKNKPKAFIPRTRNQTRRKTRQTTRNKFSYV